MDGADQAVLAVRHLEAMFLSTSSAVDVAALRETVIAFFDAAIVDDQLTGLYAKQGVLGGVYENVRVFSGEFDADGRLLKIHGLPGGIVRLCKTLSAS